MKIKQIELANKKLNLIKDLDKQIIELDKFAQQFLDGGTNSQLELSFKPKAKDKKDKVAFDEDGSLIVPKITDGTGLTYTFSFSGLYGNYKGEEKKESDNKELKLSISENLMLQTIGVLISNKQQERELHLKSLTKMGFVL